MPSVMTLEGPKLLGERRILAAAVSPQEVAAEVTQQSANLPTAYAPEGLPQPTLWQRFSDWAWKNRVAIGVGAGVAAVGVGLFARRGHGGVMSGLRGEPPRYFAEDYAEPYTQGGVELKLFIDNDYALYKQKEAIRDAIAKKVCKGQWNRDLAVKGFKHVVDAGARQYAKEFGTPGRARDIFSAQDRVAVAKRFRDEFKHEVNRCIESGDCGDAPKAIDHCVANGPQKLRSLAGRRRR